MLPQVDHVVNFLTQSNTRKANLNDSNCLFGSDHRIEVIECNRSSLFIYILIPKRQLAMSNRRMK